MEFLLSMLFTYRNFVQGQKIKHKWEGVTEYMQLVGVVVALHSEKCFPEGVWDGESEFAVPLLIYNTVCNLWMTKGLFEGNFDCS